MLEKLFKSLFLFATTLFLIGCANKTNVVFEDNFHQETINTHWTVVNGNWVIDTDHQILEVSRNAEDWAVLLCNQKLPDNYILDFSVLIDEPTYLFEVITNFQTEKFIGILFNQLDKKVAFEDRSLFFEKEKQKQDGYGYIRTTGNIGLLPKVELPEECIWRNIKIQKAGKQIFVWINNEPYIIYNDDFKILKNKGQFGFAINGKAQITKIKLIETKGNDALPPENFVPKPKYIPIFLFGE